MYTTILNNKTTKITEQDSAIQVGGRRGHIHDDFVDSVAETLLVKAFTDWLK